MEAGAQKGTVREYSRRRDGARRGYFWQTDAATRANKPTQLYKHTPVALSLLILGRQGAACLQLLFHLLASKRVSLFYLLLTCVLYSPLLSLYKACISFHPFIPVTQIRGFAKLARDTQGNENGVGVDPRPGK